MKRGATGGRPNRALGKSSGLRGIVRLGTDSEPSLPAGEVERRNGIRHGVLGRLHAEGAIEGTVHPRGGLFFTDAQQAEVVRVCGERGLFND